MVETIFHARKVDPPELHERLMSETAHNAQWLIGPQMDEQLRPPDETLNLYLTPYCPPLVADLHTTRRRFASSDVDLPQVSHLNHGLLSCMNGR